MVSVEESEKLGLGLNLIEALNNLSLIRNSMYSKIWIHLKVERVIELMDLVLC